MVAARSQDIAADTSPAAETLAGVELTADASASLAAEPAAEPTTVRSERIN